MISSDTKKRTAEKYNINLETIKKHTKDVAFDNMLPYSVQNEIKKLREQEESINEITKKLNISHYSVYKYSKGTVKRYYRYREVPDRVKKQIIELVKNGKTRLEISRITGVTIPKVKQYTKHLEPNYKITRELHEKIRNEILSGKNKAQVSRELGVKYRY
jgi:DNA-binding CsgD family transcriptional regulator